MSHHFRRRTDRNHYGLGRRTSSAFPATASTASWRRCATARTGSASSRCATRRRRRSWPAATRSSPAGSACASPPPGPGGIHLLNGLYDAKLDGQPVLAITGMHYHDLIGTHTQQDVELDKLFMDVARLQRSASWGRRTSRTSSTWRAARRSPTAASPTSPSRSTSRTTEARRAALEAQHAAPHLGRAGPQPAALPSEADLAAARPRS